MKLLKSTSILIVLLVALACNSNKEAIATTESAAPAEPTAEVTAPPQRGQGQRGQNPERKAAYEAMLTSLNLTEKQREDFDFINEKYRAQMQQLRQNNQGDWQAMREQMQELRAKQNAELKEVLNEEQFATYEKWSRENRGGRRGGGGGRGGNG